VSVCQQFADRGGYLMSITCFVLKATYLMSICGHLFCPEESTRSPINTKPISSHDMSSAAPTLHSRSAASPMSPSHGTPSPSSVAVRRAHSADESCLRIHIMTAACAPNSPQAPIRMHADVSNCGSPLRQPSSSSESSTGSGSSSGGTPKPHSLATLRDEQKAKKFEKIVRARATMKKRLSESCVLEDSCLWSKDP